MQKKLIALAVAGLVSAPAFAQSNVTIYGVADAAIGLGEHGKNDFNGVINGVLSGSRIGFRGTEDLGNGLKAVFALEQGFDIGNGVASPAVGSNEKATDTDGKTIVDGDSVFSRQAYVGLSGSFGTVSVGRQYAPGYFFNYDAVLGASVGPQSLLSAAGGMTITPNSPARWDNSVAYTGSFSGLTARAIYSMKAVETSLNPEDDDAFGLSVDYANGPLAVGAVYQYLFTDGAEDQEEWGIGGSYDFGMVKVAGSYQAAEGLKFAKGAEADLWQIGVIVPVSAAGNVHLAYGEFDRDDKSNLGAESWSLAYTHALSKRTTAYAAYNQTENESGTMAFGPVAGTANGDDSSVFAVGIRHTF
ncbi:MAG TPA: porin [Thauera sp.]|uniref:porin n=1 Tax=Thauera sp. TaxID=1905334 RepID=UPI0026282FA6|nr:porin [Thauera sp.]MCP5226050.1 porin [Thauera sp.]HRV77887.1 porin [Thauera sp.]